MNPESCLTPDDVLVDWRVSSITTHRGLPVTFPRKKPYHKQQGPGKCNRLGCKSPFSSTSTLNTLHESTSPRLGAVLTQHPQSSGPTIPRHLPHWRKRKPRCSSSATPALVPGIAHLTPCPKQSITEWLRTRAAGELRENHSQVDVDADLLLYARPGRTSDHPWRSRLRTLSASALGARLPTM